jgi:hypothetical protein
VSNLLSDIENISNQLQGVIEYIEEDEEIMLVNEEVYNKKNMLIEIKKLIDKAIDNENKRINKMLEELNANKKD